MIPMNDNCNNIQYTFIPFSLSFFPFSLLHNYRSPDRNRTSGKRVTKLASVTPLERCTGTAGPRRFDSCQGQIVVFFAAVPEQVL